MLRKTANILLVLILGSIVYSCSSIVCEECDNKIPEEMEKIGEGDYATYKRFMQKHPDPEFECCIRNSIN